ncbi:MAG: hypothetical protein GX062_08380 [Firmicutes bacterium]|nr:hypothetical protein [Bacillota bacterium]
MGFGRNLIYIVITLLLVLSLALGTVGCRSSGPMTDPGHTEPSVSSPVPAQDEPGMTVPSQGGDSTQEPNEDETGPEPGPNQGGDHENREPVELPREELPLAVELKINEDKTTLGPFFGLLPELMWSPDGEYLAIYGQASGYGLWVWERASNQVRRLAQLVERGSYGTTSMNLLGWNQEGDALLYVIDGVQPQGSHLGERGVAVMSVTLDGKRREVAWLPGGFSLIRDHYYSSESGRLLVHRGSDLWSVNTRSGEAVRLRDDLPTWDGLFAVQFSPTGESVVFPETDPSHHGLVLLDVNSGREIVIGFQGEYAFYPVWSPDGKKLAYLSARAEGESFDFQIGEDGPLPPATRLAVVTQQGEELTSWTPPRSEKAGAPVWDEDSTRLAFLSGSLTQDTYGLSQVSWRRLLLGSLDGTLQDLGMAQGDWITVAGFAPSGQEVIVYRYEASGGVTVLSYGPNPDQSTILAADAVDEPLIWWDGHLLLPRLSAHAADSLATQLYLIRSETKPQALTQGAGWKSRLPPSGHWLAYLNADNQNAPYPIQVVVQPLR